MTIKSKTSLFISIFFSILFVLSSAFVLNRFSNFRKEEFEDRLREKAMSNIRLLTEVTEVDNNLLKIIDRHTIHRLYNEKTLIFDSSFHLIYSSLDDTKINWTMDDLLYLKKHKTFFKREGDYEVYGVFYDSKSKDYFALISASDEHGKRKLRYLTFLILGVGLIFIFITWVISFRIVQKQLKPLDQFVKQIKSINDLNKVIVLKQSDHSTNEIDLISKEFNHMMGRISDAYQKQKEFTTNASHEFRTPLARISAQIENQLQHCKPDEKIFLQQIFTNVNQLKELINSLLLLSKTEDKNKIKSTSIRIDECIYNSIEKATKQYPDFKIFLNIAENPNAEQLLQANCNNQLLEIAFDNLLRNAYMYSDNNSVYIDIEFNGDKTSIQFSNSGNTLNQDEQSKLFEPFMRGQNAQKTIGLGLGLRIVHRILSVYGYSLKYQASGNKNSFIVIF